MIWLIAILATARATRLVVDDEFPFGPVRDWADDTHPWLGLLLECPWCASGYLSAVTTAVVWATYGVPLPPVAWFALWMAALLVYHFSELLAKYASRD